MTEVLVIAACVITLVLLVLRAIRHHYTDQYQFHRHVASREKLDAMMRETKLHSIVPVVIVDENGRPVE
jgi:hypothetical protein